MDLTAAIQLSSFLEGKLHNLTFAQILSAIQSLSGVPVHPYEQAKYKYFGKDYHFPTIQDIPIPIDFHYQTITQSLSNIVDHTYMSGMSALSAAEIKMKEAFEQGLPPKKSDLENIAVLDEHIIKKNIEFSEIVKSISLSDIETRPIEVAQKLLSHYTKMF